VDTNHRLRRPDPFTPALISWCVPRALDAPGDLLILALADELGRGTIETVLAKDDMELGLEALQRMMDERGR